MATVVGAIVPATPCGHKAEVGCILTALPFCCACADRRPMATAYPVYIDGEGMKNSGKRWQMYCWKCRDYYNHQIEAASISSTSSQQNIPSFEPTAMAYQTSRPGRISSLTNISLQERLASHRSARGTAEQVLTTDLNVESSRQSSDHDPRPAQTQRPEQVYPLGTREEVQQEDYQSPIAGMFTRAWSRFRIAEEVRQAERAMNPEAPIFEYNPPQPRLAQPGPAVSAPAHTDHRSTPAVIMPPLNSTDVSAQYAETDMPAGFTSGIPPMVQMAHSYPTAFFQGHTAQFSSQQHPISSDSGSVLYANPFVRPPHDEEHQQYDEQHEHGDDFDGMQPNAIDRQNRRPEPLSDDLLTANIACKICGEQKIDTLTEPCMHVATCHWCAYLWEREYRSALYQNANAKHRCVICRRVVKGTRRIWLP